MPTHRPPDFEGTFHLFSTAKPKLSGYRPHHAIHENYQTSGTHTYLDQDRVEPGETVRVAVHFITPHVYPHCIWEGRELSEEHTSELQSLAYLVCRLLLE